MRDARDSTVSAVSPITLAGRSVCGVKAAGVCVVAARRLSLTDDIWTCICIGRYENRACPVFKCSME